MQKYRVEKSLDGNNFTSVADVAAGNKGAAKYDFTDINPSFGNNYYRINSITKDGNATYSQIVKVSIASASSISIFPNPLTKGIINLQFTNAPAGKYGVRLINPLGEVVISKIIYQTSGNNKERIQCDHLSKGIYQLNITKPDGAVVVEPIVVL
jgi:hypothetical protein